jgi:hypothetical protein
MLRPVGREVVSASGLLRHARSVIGGASAPSARNFGWATGAVGYSDKGVAGSRPNPPRSRAVVVTGSPTTLV